MIQRRKRPHVPGFIGCPVPKHTSISASRNAKIVMSYFRPWTLCELFAEEHVPFVRDLREEGRSWPATLQSWLEGRIVSADSQRPIGNFLSVYRLRKGDDEHVDGNSDDLLSDVEFVLNEDVLLDVLQSRPVGRRRKELEEAVVETRMRKTNLLRPNRINRRLTRI